MDDGSPAPNRAATTKYKCSSTDFECNGATEYHEAWYFPTGQSMNKTQVRDAIGYVGNRSPIIFMILGFYVPLISIVVFSFWERSGLWMEPAFTMQNYEVMFTRLDSQLIGALRSGLLAGALAIVLALPIAYLASFVMSDFRRMVMLSIFAIPFFVSPFVRITLWVPILGKNGLFNNILIGAGIVDEPVRWFIFSETGMMIGVLSSFAPFVVFTGWLSMQMIDTELLNASSDLGAKPLTTVRKIIIPLALPGISVGGLFVVAATMGESIFPLVLGGTNATSIGLITRRAFTQLNVPLAAAVTVISLVLYIGSLVVITQYVDLDEMFQTLG